jgi:hypothetical protein
MGRRGPGPSRAQRFAPEQAAPGPSEGSQVAGGVMQGLGGLLSLIPAVGPAIGGAVAGVGSAIPAVDAAASGSGADVSNAIGRFGGAAGTLARDPRLAPAPPGANPPPVPNFAASLRQPMQSQGQAPQPQQQPQQQPGQQGRFQISHPRIMGADQNTLRQQIAAGNRPWFNVG